jgi:hypothetical protein
LFFSQSSFSTKSIVGEDMFPYARITS